MIPFFVGRGTGAASGGSVSVQVPNTLPGDLMLMFVETNNEALSAPSGWTEASNSPSTNAGTNPTRLHVFYKRAGSSESSVTSGDSGDHQVCQIMAVRGAIETGDPFDVTATGSGTGTSISITGTTTTANECLIVTACASTVDGTDSTNTFSGWTNSNLTNILETCDISGSAGTGGAVGVAVGDQATAGDYGSTTVTQGTSVEYATWSGAIKPAATQRPYYVTLGTFAHGTGALTLGLPSILSLGSVRENDIIVAVLETNNEAISITGYTEAASSPASNAGTNPTRTTVLWKRAGASESGPTTSDSGDHQTGRLFLFRNAIETDSPFDVTNSTTGSSGTAITIPGVTTTKDNTCIIAAAASTRSAINTDNFSSWTNSDIANLIEVHDTTWTDGTGGGFGVAVGVKSSAGSIGSTSVTQATSVEWSGWIGALKFSDDAPAGGGGTNHGYGFFGAL